MFGEIFHNGREKGLGGGKLGHLNKVAGGVFIQKNSRSDRMGGGGGKKKNQVEKKSTVWCCLHIKPGKRKVKKKMQGPVTQT